jgi:hypothetical protein
LAVVCINFPTDILLGKVDLFLKFSVVHADLKIKCFSDTNSPKHR